MGQVTHSRKVDHHRFDGLDTSDSTDPQPRKWELYGPGGGLSVQVTTSYRTGRRAGGTSVEEDSETALLNATNYRDRFKIMKEEYRAKPKSVLDNGHEFKTSKARVTYCSWISTRVSQGGGSWLGYDGPVWPSQWPSGTLPNGTYLDAGVPDLGWYGPRAIEATTPTNPAAEVATALTELWREGIPRPPGLATQRGLSSTGNPSRGAGVAGGEHLNIEFGWKPLINDLQRVLGAVKDSNKILKQHVLNSGESIRRQYTFPVERSFESRPETLGILQSPSQNTAWREAFVNGSTSGQMSEDIQTEREVWFSGAYTYHLVESSNITLDKIEAFEQKANLLLGTRITPEVVWNVSPWSWLADWRWNLGTNIANATALLSDGLTLRYGYLMVKTTTRHTYTLIGPRLKSAPDTKAPYTITFVKVTKERIRASPFGFGSNPASFTVRQWSILGALGMTRGDKALRLND